MRVPSALACPRARACAYVPRPAALRARSRHRITRHRHSLAGHRPGFVEGARALQTLLVHGRSTVVVVRIFFTVPPLHQRSTAIVASRFSNGFFPFEYEIRTYFLNANWRPEIEYSDDDFFPSVRFFFNNDADHFASSYYDHHQPIATVPLPPSPQRHPRRRRTSDGFSNVSRRGKTRRLFICFVFLKFPLTAAATYFRRYAYRKYDRLGLRTKPSVFARAIYFRRRIKSVLCT